MGPAAPTPPSCEVLKGMAPAPPADWEASTSLLLPEEVEGAAEDARMAAEAAAAAAEEEVVD